MRATNEAVRGLDVDFDCRRARSLFWRMTSLFGCERATKDSD